MTKVEKKKELRNDIDKYLSRLVNRYGGHYLLIAQTPCGEITKKTTRKWDEVEELFQAACLKCQ